MFLIVNILAWINVGHRVPSMRFPPIPEFTLLCVIILSGRMCLVLPLPSFFFLIPLSFAYPTVSASYLIATLIGTIQDNHLDPLLIDLPALCLLSCVTFISMKQDEEKLILCSYNMAKNH
jgi:hypothetical protein